MLGNTKRHSCSAVPSSNTTKPLPNCVWLYSAPPLPDATVSCGTGPMPGVALLNITGAKPCLGGVGFLCRFAPIYRVRGLSKFDKDSRQTDHIEHWFNTLRQRLARLSRESLSFFKSDFFHGLAFCLFVHHYQVGLYQLKVYHYLVHKFITASRFLRRSYRVSPAPRPHS